MSGQVSWVFGTGAGPSPVPPAGVLTLGQAEDDRRVEGVSGPQSVHHAGRWESVRVEQPSIRAQRVGALLRPGTDQCGPVTPSSQRAVRPALAPASSPSRGRPGCQAPSLLTPAQGHGLTSASSPLPHAAIQAPQGLLC